MFSHAGVHHFTCADKCAEVAADDSLSKPFPELMQCPGSTASSSRSPRHERQRGSSSPPSSWGAAWGHLYGTKKSSKTQSRMADSEVSGCKTSLCPEPA